MKKIYDIKICNLIYRGMNTPNYDNTSPEMIAFLLGCQSSLLVQTFGGGNRRDGKR